MESNSDSIQNSIDFDENIIANIFCLECHEFPEYSIRFLSASNFSLIHCCFEGKYVEKYVDLKQKCEPFSLKCKYCEKKCKICALNTNILYAENALKNMIKFLICQIFKYLQKIIKKKVQVF